MYLTILPASIFHISILPFKVPTKRKSSSIWNKAVGDRLFLKVFRRVRFLYFSSTMPIMVRRSVKLLMQRIVELLYITCFHLSSIIVSWVEGTGAPTSLGPIGLTGSGFAFFFGFSSSSSFYSSSSMISLPSSSKTFFFSTTTTGSGCGGGGYNGASATSSASKLYRGKRRSGWLVEDQM